MLLLKLIYLKFKHVIQLMMILIFLLFGSGAGIWTLNQNGFFQLTSIDFVIQNKNEDEKLFEVPIENLKEKLLVIRYSSLLELNLSKVSQYLKKQSWIEDFYLQKNWPKGLTIQVKLKPVHALLVSAEKENFPVIEEGKLLPAVPNQNHSKTILTGSELNQSEKRRGQAVEILKGIPREGKFSLKNIEEMSFREGEGFWVQLISQQFQEAIPVKLGTDRIESKSRRLTQVVDYLENNQFKVRVIDANLEQKVLVRLRKDP